MVTYFNRKDLVSFGSYLLSETRKAKINASFEQELKEGVVSPFPLSERLQAVHHADVQNWIEENEKVKHY